jgi:Domain of unknown function (DUF222)
MSVLEMPPQGALGAALATRQAAAHLASFDVTALSGSEAVELLSVVGPLLAQLESVSVAATHVVRESGVWGLNGSRSAKAYLERTTGASAGKIAGDLKLSERLASVLPRTADALRAGTISGEHARVMSRVACSSPARIEALAHPDKGESFLLSHAGLAVDQFKIFVATWGHRVDPDADDAKRLAAADDFHLDLAETMDGVHVRGFLTPEAGEALQIALTAVIGIPSKVDGRTSSRRRHDALATLCQLALDGPGLGTSGGVRPQIVARVNWETLIAMPGATGLDPAVLQESGTPIPRRVLERIACDSEVTRIVFGPQSQVLDVGRSQRTFTGARRRALDARDGGCRAPGCDAPPRISEGHHSTLWSRGGRTCPEEGCLLCWAHHDWVHERDITLTWQPDGGLRFDGPDGRCYGTTYPRQLRFPT